MMWMCLCFRKERQDGVIFTRHMEGTTNIQQHNNKTNHVNKQTTYKYSYTIHKPNSEQSINNGKSIRGAWRYVNVV